MTMLRTFALLNLVAGSALAVAPTITNCPHLVRSRVGVEIVLPITAAAAGSGQTVTVQQLGDAVGTFTLAPSSPVPGAVTNYVFRWTPTAPTGPSPTGRLIFSAVDSNGARSSQCFTLLEVANTDTFSTRATVRDFQQSATDFNRANGDVGVPIVLPTLGANRKPVFNTAVAHTTVASATSFGAWFNDVQGTNKAIDRNASFKRSYPSTGLDHAGYVFTRAPFQPIDSEGFDVGQVSAVNQFFTWEHHSGFGYEPGLQLSFTSSDDLWVFINEQLVVDLGGIHGPSTFVLDVDSIAAGAGLLTNPNGRIDMFYAHRGQHAAVLTASLNAPQPCGDREPREVDLSAATMFGTAAFAPNDGGVQLINAFGSSFIDAGAVWSSELVPLTNGFHVDFRVDVKRSNTPNTFEGFALVIGDAPGVGAPAGGIGYAGISNAIAVEFDARQHTANFDPASPHESIRMSAGPLSANDSTVLATSTFIDAELHAYQIALWNAGYGNHMRVSLDPDPGADVTWLRVYNFVSDAGSINNPVVIAPIRNSQLSTMFPSGNVRVGLTTSSDSASGASLFITNWTISYLRAQQTCGVGACLATVPRCSGGLPRMCTPGSGGTEVCNGLDDDCDGSTDESLGMSQCGLGLCERVVDNCSAGVPQVCMPGVSALEVCGDGVDQDCDGVDTVCLDAGPTGGGGGSATGGGGGGATGGGGGSATGGGGGGGGATGGGGGSAAGGGGGSATGGGGESATGGGGGSATGGGGESATGGGGGSPTSGCGCGSTSAPLVTLFGALLFLSRRRRRSA